MSAGGLPLRVLVEPAGDMERLEIGRGGLSIEVAERLEEVPVEAGDVVIDVPCVPPLLFMLDKSIGERRNANIFN